MNIESIVKSFPDDNSCSLLLDEIYSVIEEKKSLLHLVNVLNFEKQLHELVEEYDLKDKLLVLSKEINISDQTTNGWWSLLIDVVDKDTDDCCLEDSVYYEFLSIIQKFNIYEFEHRINESYEEGQSFKMQLNDTKKVFEFLLPNKVLTNYLATTLNSELEINKLSDKRKLKL